MPKKEKQPNICPVCGSKMSPALITHTQPWGNESFEFRNVPALVCSCGEVWLSAEVTDRMDEIIKSKAKPKEYHKIPVFSFSEFAL